MTEVPDNPDRECNNCGNRDWKLFEERKPRDYPDASDVKKYYFRCTECNGNGYVYEENGHTRYTHNLR